MRTLLEEIVAELTRPLESAPPICASTVRRWMERARGEARGAIYSLLTDVGVYARVAPPLGFDEVFDWLLSYYAWCLRTNPGGEWSGSRFEAAWDMVIWFIGMWDEGRDRSYFERIRECIAELYLTGSRRIGQAVVQGCLEHLFEREDIKEFFQSWKGHPQLRQAYDQALLWVLGGGKTPLSRCRGPTQKTPESDG
jgi:hypothetical protein